MLTKNKKSCCPYYFVIALCAIMFSACSVGLLSYFNSLFTLPVTEELGLSRASFALHSTASTLTTMIFMPFAGMLFARKISIKVLLLAGTILCSGAHWCYSLSSTAWQFCVGGVLAGLGSCLCGAIAITRLCTNWFQSKRGFVTGIAFTGAGIVSSLFTPAVSRLIEQAGWRMGYRTIALAILCLMLPTVLILVKEKPAEIGLEPYREAGEAESNFTQKLQGFTQIQALKLPCFWTYAGALLLLGLIVTSTQYAMVAYWIDVGNDPSFAARMYSIVMFLSIFAKMGIGILFDKVPTRAAISACCGAVLIALVGLVVFDHGFLVLIPVIFFGMATAVQVILCATMTNRLFGDLAYASLYALLMPVLYLGISIGNPLCAAIYDATGTYKIAFILFAVLALALWVLLLLADKSSRKAFVKVLDVQRNP